MISLDKCRNSEFFSKEHINKYHWGTYKPNLYFAMKEKKSTTDVFGLMWYNPSSNGYKQFGSVKTRMRHECKKEDKVNYYWEYHNGLDYGSQFINDEEQNNMRLNTQMIKREYNDTDQSWEVLLHGEESKKKAEKNNIGLVLYVSMEEYELKEKSFWQIEQKGNDYEIKGMRGEKQQSIMTIKLEGENKGTELINTQYQKYRKAYNQTWRVKEFVTNELGQNEEEFIKKNKTYSYLNFGETSSTKQPNVIAIQLILTAPFDIVIRYSTNLNLQGKSLDDIEHMISLKQKEFNDKFGKVFSGKSSVSEDIKQMSKEALSGILGGIGYFYGPIESNSQERYEPEAIFTGTPCRSFFARGFLWDEGFHHIIISKWDIHLSIDILDSYLNTIDSNGWIPREQIRGEEAKSQVPPEFIKQNNKIANPPTLIFPINSFISYYKYFGETDKEIDMKTFLKKAFRKIKKWFEWYRVTQTDSKGIKYQWYGRVSSHNFPSGFDDLPRGMTMNERENHLDLYIWMIELVKTLKDLSNMFDLELYEYYHSIELHMNKEIKGLFFDDELKIYNDYLGPQFKRKIVSKYPRKVFPYLWRGDNQCGDQVKNPLGSKAECNPYSDSMCCSEFGWCGNSQGHCKCEKCTFYDKLENRREFVEKENTFNPHLGYIQLFPIFFGTYQGDSNEMDQLLNYILDENELLSNAGIRSLSKSDLLYHTGEDYWRGHVWMNINYLILRGLYNHYLAIPKAKKAYILIRERVIQAVYSTWKEEHFFYEQYNDITTKGRKNYPFNGWTALVLNIITEQYDK